MAFGAENFEQIEVMFSAAILGACKTDQTLRKQTEEATRTLVTKMLERAPVTSKEANDLLEKADLNATIGISHRPGTPLQAPLIDIILKYGRGHEDIFEQILHKVQHPGVAYKDPRSRMAKGTQSRLWVALSRLSESDYLSSFIDHPEIDIEALHPEKKMSLLSVLCERLIGSDPSLLLPDVTSGYDPRKIEKYTTLIHKLLARGAMLDPEYVTLVCHDEEHCGQLATALRPYIDGAQKNWETIMNGTQSASEATAQQLQQFVSLGYLAHMVQSEQWQTCYDNISSVCLQLPDWFMTRYPMEHELSILYAKMAPRNIIHEAHLQVNKSPKERGR